MDADARRRLGANMVRLAAGDRAVFDEVFAALWPPLLTLARRLLDSESEAEDAAQEALLEVLGNTERYDPSRDALSWAFAITAYEARTLRQRRRRRRETTGAAAPEPRAASTPEADLADAELRAQLARSVDLLSDQDREEIASYLGLAPDLTPGAPLAPARRKRRQRALARLRSIWRSLHGFEP
jgi:RNA polymerase sigma factor (sigma-70 family)